MNIQITKKSVPKFLADFRYNHFEREKCLKSFNMKEKNKKK